MIWKKQLPAIEELCVIGLDNWALKKGKRYGTVICDLEWRRPIELLESRKEKGYQKSFSTLKGYLLKVQKQEGRDKKTRPLQVDKVKNSQLLMV